MKFILLSNVVTLAVLATAPGASAAGLRARANQHGGKDANADASTSSNTRQDDETRGSSGRRNLYGRSYYYFPTETWHNSVQESYMPDPNRDGIPYGMNIPGMSPGEASYAPYGLPSASNFGRPSGMLQGEDETQYEPQVKTGPGSVHVSQAVLRDYANYCRAQGDNCRSTPGCSKYCPPESAHVSKSVLRDYANYCRSQGDNCSSTQGCKKYCAAKSDIEHEWGHHNRNWFCGKIQTQDKCHQHDRDHQCGWDEHHDPPCHVY